MSTLNVTNLQGPSSTGTAATLSSINGGPISGARNRIINGDMRIDQRNGGASISLPAVGGNAYLVDRWFVENATDGTFTAQQTTDAPAGFSNSLKITVTSTDTSLAADQSAFVQQRVEGFNSSDFNFGSGAASTVTISFWVKSSVIGTFGGAIANSAYNRARSFSFAISAANTWEYKTVTVAGDTAGTWVGATNGVGLRLSFALCAGSDRASTAGSWSNVVGIGVTGGANLMATNGATFYITGIQLEAGTVATPFERRSYGQELSLCQRYFASTFFYGFGYTPATGNHRVAIVYLPATMRSTPSITFTSATGANVSGQNAENVRTTGFGVFTSVFSPGNYSIEGSVVASAEL